MFYHFCTALALECIYMQHGRGMVLANVMESYIEVVEIVMGDDVAPSVGERVH